MKPIAPILFGAALLSSCSTTTAFLNPDQSINVVHRGSFEMPSDLWISGAADGKLTPADQLKVIQTTTIKGTHRRQLECAGFVDRTVPGKIELQLATTGYVFPGPTWAKHAFCGTYKLHPADN